MIHTHTINNDIDLYYHLNIVGSVKNINNIDSNKQNNFDIKDYEKLIDSIYSNDTNLISDTNLIPETNLILNDMGNNKNNNEKQKFQNINSFKNPNTNPNYHKIISKKKIFCEECGNDNIIEDTSLGILVCKTCGQVIANLMDCGAEWTQYNDDNKKDMNRCSHPISQLLPQSSTATTIAGSCSSRIKTLHGWSAMPYKERSLNEVFKIMQKKCFQGRIMKCIEDDAKIMYKNISDCKHTDGKNMGKSIIIRGKNRMSVIAACILFACRKKDKTRSPKEIAELFELKYTEITKGCKIFQKLAKFKNIELKVNSTKPEQFIVRFCEELKIKKEYTIQAIQISNNAEKLQIASVHTPISLATGSIYLMIYLNNLDIQKKIIADKFNVSQVTIAKAFKKLEPFMDLLTNNDMCEQLSVEIKKYQDNIELTEELKPKFMRFNININECFGKDQKYIYNVLEIDDNKNYIFNNNTIINHNLEIDYKMKQIDNEYIRLNMNFVDDLYKLTVKN